MLAYLEAENAYLEAELADVGALRESLFQEVKGRIRETDLSLPVPWGPWLYYQRTTAGDEYPRHYRCPRPADGSLRTDTSREELLLDPNALADGGYLSLGAFEISPDTVAWPTAWIAAATRSTGCSSGSWTAACCTNCPSRTATAT